MTWRTTAVAMLLLAAALYWGVARPHEGRALAAADAYARARDERRAVRARLRAAEARLLVARRMEEALRRVAATPEEAVRHVRRSVVEAIGGTGVRDVRLGVRPGAHELGVQLGLTGPPLAVLDAAGRVARPGTGVVLDRVDIARRKTGVAMELAGVAPIAGAGSR